MAKYRVDTDKGSYEVETEDAPAAPAIPGMEKLGGTAPSAPRTALPPALSATPTPGALSRRPTNQEVLGPPATGFNKVLLGGAYGSRSGTNAPTDEYRDPSVKIPLISDMAEGPSDIVHGANQMGADITPTEKSKGMTQQRAFLQGGTRMLGGVAKTGSAMIPEALAVAPARTVAAFGVGAVNSKLTHAGLKAVGADDDTAEFGSELNGLLAGGATAKATPMPNPLRVDPRIAINRSLRPVPSDPNFPKRVPQTLATIRAANEGKIPGGITDGTLDVVPAANKAIDSHQDVLQQWIDRAQHVRISGDPIVKATADATGGMLPSESASAKSLVARARQDYGSEFTPQQLRDRLKLLNERLSPFYDKSPAKQSSALADIPDAVLKAQRDAVAELLYKTLDPEGQGAGPRDVQSRTGDLIDLRDAAMRRNNAIVAEQPLTPLGKLVDPVKGFVRSMMPGKATGAGIAYAEGSEGRSLPLLRRAFKAVSDEQVPPIPSPQGLYPTGPNGRLLAGPNQPNRSPYPPGAEQHQTGGTLYTPPPADTSSVHSVPGMPSAPFQRKAITPGRGAIVTPPPSDPSGVNISTGAPLRAPFSRQLPAAPSVRPPSDLSGNAGDITDTVPIKNPVTGKIEYIPRPQRISGPVTLYQGKQ